MSAEASSSYDSSFDFHGLRILASSNEPKILDQLSSRLRCFFTADHGHADFSFSFHTAPNAPHEVDELLSTGRTVYESGQGRAVYLPSEDRLYLTAGDRARVVCEPAMGEARFSVRSGDDNLWLASHSLFTLAFIELLKRRGMMSTHASGLSRHGHALLVAGRTGCGKTTLALTLLRAGFGFLGDDMCFVSRSEDGLRIRGFPDEVDLTEETMGMFPELRGFPRDGRRGERGKIPLLPERAFEVRFASECRPGSIVFPLLVDSMRSAVEPMDRSEALVQLAPNVLLTEAASSQSHLDVLADLVRSSRCVRLKLGRDLDRLPALLEGCMPSGVSG